MTYPPLTRCRVVPFAVEDTAVQLTWSALPAPTVDLVVGDQRRTVMATPHPVFSRAHRPPRVVTLPGGFGGPGTVSFAGLEPSTAYEVVGRGAGLPATVLARFRTLASPPGTARVKVATLTDVHLGEGHFGALGTIEEPTPLAPGTEPFPLRAARAALAEALAWGADAVVVKGDLTRLSDPADFRQAGRLLGSLPVPTFVALGNHDVHRGADPAALLAGYGVRVAPGPIAHDLPGLRLVLGCTPSPTTKWGMVGARQRAQLAALAGGAPGPALVVVHHQPEAGWATRCYPPGVGRPDADALLDALAGANPATLLTAGHTHRHRRRQHGPVVVTETGSPKDYPGTWTGYAATDGGIRQVVRRVADPEVISWTEVTGRALGGIWRWWSPGTLGARCFTHVWPARTG